MKFIIQHNEINSGQLQLIEESTKGLPREFVGVIPFDRKITSEMSTWIALGLAVVVILNEGLCFHKLTTECGSMHNSTDCEKCGRVNMIGVFTIFYRLLGRVK